MGVSKRFPGVLALDGVSISIRRGEVHGLIGENGAGKTTLMRIAYGFYRPDDGRIRVDGNEVELTTPRRALDLGIGMVHQHSLLVESFTVAENIMLGTQTGLTRLPRRQVERELAEVAEEFRMGIDPGARVETLGVAARQQVEILRVLHARAKVMILDEPTAVLTPQEANQLLDDLGRYRDLGTTIVLITHKLPEVMRVTDRVTVLRRGQVVHEQSTNETSPAKLAKEMVGRPVELRNPRANRGEGTGASTTLSVRSLMTGHRSGEKSLDGIDLEIAPGEIVGLAGIEGNGASELIECLAGLRAAAGGSIHLDGRNITDLNTAARRELGVRHVPEDRLDRGANPDATLGENLILGRHRRTPLRRGPFLLSAEVEKFATQMIDRFSIKAPGAGVRAGSLSGGNLQKAVIAREVESDARLVLAAQPTRGVDVGASVFIKDQLAALAEAGVAVLVSSVELADLIDLSDRIVVLYEGRIAGVLTHEEATEEAIGLLMAGGTHDGG